MIESEDTKRNWVIVVEILDQKMGYPQKSRDDMKRIEQSSSFVSFNEFIGRDRHFFIAYENGAWKQRINEICGEKGVIG